MRFKALESLEGKFEAANGSDKKMSELFGTYVFNEKVMHKYLSPEAFESVKEATEKGEKINHDIADQVASGMKNWALDHNATHYTHWFQPLTGLTAEKHDAFFVIKNGEPMEVFTGENLVQQEPDASSFPSGGIRSTFEARGYTAWDPTSPAFLIKTRSGVITLCIPTIFVSYTGEALDYKAPLLRALNQLDSAATRVCQLFDKEVKRVSVTLGTEQEYFLIDAALAKARPDLLLAGRTLFGHAPAKGQQLEDHYFGSIPERVHGFMSDMEMEAMRLGIPLKTRHNEVAPSQFECAPMFEEANIAVDHNSLLQDIIDKVSRRHKFLAVLHEKPFAGINGSGKHCNWSMSTDTGVNLLSPGDTPISNLQFLTFFICSLKAVHEHADLLRASIASAPNDHRLGANEAPPAIISAFIGTGLSKVIDRLIKDELIEKDGNEISFKIDIPKIPMIKRDNTDRNRTSPFAFTGNKFELRAVGSSANPASSMTVLNAIVADQLIKFKKEVDEELQQNSDQQSVILKILKRYARESKNIIFEGNNYSEEWVEEAKRRGLNNITNTPEALDAYTTPKTIDVFVCNNIMTEREVLARHEILLDHYTKKIQIESRLAGEMALTQIIPAAIAYQNKLLRNVSGLKKLGLNQEAEPVIKSIRKMSEHISIIKELVHQMIEERKIANKIEEEREKAIAYCFKIKPLYEKMRYHADKLELMVDDRIWPLPKYRELLFLR